MINAAYTNRNTHRSGFGRNNTITENRNPAIIIINGWLSKKALSGVFKPSDTRLLIVSWDNDPGRKHIIEITRKMAIRIPIVSLFAFMIRPFLLD